jgi:hypothetical protein
MKTTWIRSLALIALASLPACASTLDFLGQDSETGLFARVDYLFRTNGDKGINTGQTGFTPDSGTAVVHTVQGVSYADYLTALAPGATVTGATLSFDGMFGPKHVSSSITNGTLFYRPAFDASLGAYQVTITSGSTSVNVSGASGAGYDLWTLFKNDILAGDAIHIQWGAVETFSANTGSYGNNFKNRDETFNVQDTRTFTAGETNLLSLVYKAPATSSPVPEPASTILVGIGLTAVACAVKRFRHNA